MEQIYSFHICLNSPGFQIPPSSFWTSHVLLRKIFRWLNTRQLNMLKAEKCLEEETEIPFSLYQNTTYLKDVQFLTFPCFYGTKDGHFKPKHFIEDALKQYPHMCKVKNVQHNQFNSRSYPSRKII